MVLFRFENRLVLLMPPILRHFVDMFFLFGGICSSLLRDDICIVSMPVLDLFRCAQARSLAMSFGDAGALVGSFGDDVDVTSSFGIHRSRLSQASGSVRPFVHRDTSQAT